MTVTGDRAVWSCKQGDDWVRSWSLASSSRTWDFTNLLVQIRNTDTGALVATSEAEPAAGVWEIDTTGSDDSGPIVLALSTPVAADADPSAKYVIEAECDIDGAHTTFLEHSFEVLKQWAVAT